jgi:predicted DNA-binding transcriptional regulator AlpA
MHPYEHKRLRTPEAATYVGLSPSTLEKMRIQGIGPTYEKSGRKIVVYRISDLEAWLAARRRTSTSDNGAAAA